MSVSHFSISRLTIVCLSVTQLYTAQLSLT